MRSTPDSQTRGESAQFRHNFGGAGRLGLQWRPSGMTIGGGAAGLVAFSAWVMGPTGTEERSGGGDSDSAAAGNAI